MSPKLNFSEVEEFVPVDVGSYLAEVTKSSPGLSGRAGARKWTLQLKVIGAIPGKEEYQDKTITWDISLQKQALWKVMQTLRALGEDIPEGETEFNFDAESYIGRTCVMVVTKQAATEEFEERTRVSRLRSADDWAAILERVAA